MSAALPRLRWPLDFNRISHQGNNYIHVRDPRGLAPDSILVPEALMAIASHFDGAHTIDKIVADGSTFGVTRELVESLLRDLDNYNLLENEKTERLWQTAKQTFAAEKRRELALADAVYPKNPSELRTTIETYLQNAARVEAAGAVRRVRALANPHIDYQRGGHTYAATFNALRDLEKPDVVILLGTSHQPGKGVFHGAFKDFETGFGAMPAARGAIEQLAALYGRERFLGDEILHKREHSLELQLPFLGHRFSAAGLPAVLPILIGSFHRWVENSIDPCSSAEVGEFIEALTTVVRTLEKDGQKVLLYAGIDLAHVGLHFGDRTRVAPASLSLIEQRDRQFLDFALQGDTAKIFAHVAEDQDRRRLCGFPTLYTMLSVMRGAGFSCEGKLVEYRQAVDAASDCIVTFAGAYWADIDGSITAPI